MTRATLAVLVDGAPLADEEARAIWERFSAWMEEHRGDLAGFAAREGFASIHPGVDQGKPVLLASKSAPQRPYATATSVSRPKGSGAEGPGHARRDRPRKKSKK